MEVAGSSGDQCRRDAQADVSASDGEKSSALWGPEQRNFAAGMILVITLVAFEAMGLGTALPSIVRELDAQHWYSWPFTVFMAASAVGTVLGGRFADPHGPAPPLLLALPMFAAGLLAAGLAPNILVGFGGVLVTALSTARAPTAGVAALDLLLAGVAGLAAVLVYRSRPALSLSRP